MESLIECDPHRTQCTQLDEARGAYSLRQMVSPRNFFLHAMFHVQCSRRTLRQRVTCPTCRRPFIELPNDAPVADGQQPPSAAPGADPGEHFVNSADLFMGAMENLRDMGIDPEAFFVQATRGARRQEDDREPEFSGMYS